ncbi:PREDICTED: 60S ribosomal export protein NMD3-like [Priapulus caudatus]|uniref:60S ribosomal export protein NMD3 n=1 Tax=Priapulus caudatus TaxID=37621 RepID=A0ABM1E0J5_PRICU|nr:PREDICTED: 60S ribosomal export protein NMD3-like [Priapulus caudatus]
MEYIQGQQPVAEKTSSTILCCECGTPIEPNPANMCVACLRTQVDITEGIPKQATLYFCRNCERYLQPPAQWIKAVLESRELLSICLKKLKGISKVRLIDAGFVWTEPHSKRVKVKLTIQKEVMGGTILQQVFIVEYVVNNQMCTDCHRVEAKDFWKAVVQVRQKAEHKKTFFYLEQLIMKHKAHTDTLKIERTHDGLDFFYASKDGGRKIVDFMQAVVPIRYATSQKLISHDVHNNTYAYKYTFSVEIIPICKDDVVCISKKLAQQYGNITQICICLRVTSNITLIDPNTLQVPEFPANVFWPKPLRCGCACPYFSIAAADECGRWFFQHILADVYVCKATELGMSDSQYHCRTHLGHLLNPLEYVLFSGFDLSNSNVNDHHLSTVSPDKIPDVVIVKKVYLNRRKRIQKRKWKLKHLQKDADDTSSIERDYNDFLDDLEEDPLYRKNINIYQDRDKMAVDTDDTGDEDLPQITLAEMLEDLDLTEAAGHGGEEGTMGEEDGAGGESSAMLE